GFVCRHRRVNTFRNEDVVVLRINTECSQLLQAERSNPQTRKHDRSPIRRLHDGDPSNVVVHLSAESRLIFLKYAIGNLAYRHCQTARRPMPRVRLPANVKHKSIAFAVFLRKRNGLWIEDANE